MNTAATSAEQNLKKCSVSLKPTNSRPARNAKARKPARNFRRWRRSVQAIPVPADTPAVAARAAALAERGNLNGRAPYFPIKFPQSTIKTRDNMTELGFQTTLKLPYEKALEKVTEALQAEGFGVLTSIDVKETMKKKLDVDFRKYTILGACNPPLAHRALGARLELGLLLPCNVIVYEEDGATVVNIVDPLAMFSSVDDPALEPVAAEARERLKRVSETLQK
jgi:uncharacterized protein (DUF302 family)